MRGVARRRVYRAGSLLALLMCLLEANAPAAEGSRFSAIDIFVDARGGRLAAYQMEFKATGSARIVGIEGGEHPAFKDPPFYDPKAIQQNRAVLAAFSTAVELPATKTRVATVHVQEPTGTAPEYVLTLQVAANERGGKLQAQASFVERSQR